MNQDLKKYIDQMHKLGYSDEQIKENLKKAGWSNKDINSEIATMSSINPHKDQPKLTGITIVSRTLLFILLVFFLGTLYAFSDAIFFYIFILSSLILFCIYLWLRSGIREYKKTKRKSAFIFQIIITILVLIFLAFVAYLYFLYVAFEFV